MASQLNSIDGGGFGLVPSQIINNILRGESQKVRLAAMKSLDSEVSQAVGAYDPRLPRFLASHINDANVSISQLATQALTCVLKRGCECDMNLGAVLGSDLVDKLGSSKTSVQQASSELIVELLQQPQPRAMVAALTAAPMHTNWRVRIESIALLSEHVFGGKAVSCDFVALVNTLARAAEDTKLRQLAVDALLKINGILGSRFQVLLSNGSASAAVKQAVAKRLGVAALQSLKGQTSSRGVALEAAGTPLDLGVVGTSAPSSRRGSRDPMPNVPSRSRVSHTSSLGRPDSGGMGPGAAAHAIGKGMQVHSGSGRLGGNALDSEAAQLFDDSGRTSSGEGRHAAGGSLADGAGARRSAYLNDPAVRDRDERMLESLPVSIPAGTRVARTMPSSEAGLREDSHPSSNLTLDHPSKGQPSLSLGQPRAERPSPAPISSAHSIGSPAKVLKEPVESAVSGLRSHQLALSAQSLDVSPSSSAELPSSIASSTRALTLEELAAERLPTFLPATARVQNIAANGLSNTRADPGGRQPSLQEVSNFVQAEAEEARTTSQQAWQRQEDRAASADSSTRAIAKKLQLLKRRQLQGSPHRLGTRRVSSAHAALAVNPEVGIESGTPAATSSADAEARLELTPWPSDTALHTAIKPPVQELQAMTILKSQAPGPLHEETMNNSLQPMSAASSPMPEFHQMSKPTVLAEPRSQPGSPAASLSKDRPARKLFTAPVAEASFGRDPACEDISAGDLAPCSNPAAVLQAARATLAKCNVADRLDLDWQAQNAALTDLRRLAEHHGSVLEPQLGGVVRDTAPALLALRSNTAKNAMTLLRELFEALGRAMDGELETLMPPLAQRSGEVSNAGRDTFLATEADETICVMIQHLSPSKVAVALTGAARHKSPQVRAKMAGHLDELMQSTKGEELAGNGVVMERVFQTAAGMLEEGSQDARTYAKRLIWRSRQLADASSPAAFQRLLAGLAGEARRQKVLEVSKAGLVASPVRRSLTQSRASSAASSQPSSPARSHATSPLKGSSRLG